MPWGDTLDDTHAPTPSPTPTRARTPNLSTQKSPPASATLARPLHDTAITKYPSPAASIPSSSAPPSRIGTPQIRTSPSNDWDADEGGWSGVGGGENSSGNKMAATSLSAMSKGDKAAEMARRREERKQVSCRTQGCLVKINDFYAEDCATEGAEEGRHLKGSYERTESTRSLQ